MKLLVSVRSGVEALVALAGGADLIDVKEPARGPLGRADDKVIAKIVSTVDGQRPVSAAMGELKDAVEWISPSCPLTYVKFGLAGFLGHPWRERLVELQRAATSFVVPTAYADAERAEAPAVEDVAAFAIANNFPVLLIDTFRKDGHDLFKWTTEERLCLLVERLRIAGVAVALAGSLTQQQLPTVRRINPAWLAVRGAVCTDGRREGTIDKKCVRLLKSLLSLASGAA